MPVAAFAIAGLGASTVAVPATAASATSVASTEVAATKKDKDRSKKRASRGKRAAYPIQYKYVKRYKLKRSHLREIAKAKVWAKGWKPRRVRQCESGGNYRINTGNGYYGAYQFHAATWRGIGGGRYASHAHRAPKFAQDHMAYRLWKRSGWGPWGCA
jgi:hypothetical protein